MSKPSQEELIQEYIEVADELDKDEPTLSEFQQHGDYYGRLVYNAFEDFTELKHRALFRQGKQLYKSEEYLRREYIEKRRSTKEIAQDWDTSGSGIHHWIDKHGIETRERGDTQTDGDLEKLRDKDWLKNEYIDKERSSTDIADEVGVCSDTVFYWLENHGLEIRDTGLALTNGELGLVRDKKWLKEQYIEEEKSMHQIADECNVEHSTVKNYIHKFGIQTRDGGTDMSDGDIERLNDRGEIERLYWDEELSMQEIANELGVYMKTVHRKMQKFSIPRRDYDEFIQSGKDHHMFKENYTENYGPLWHKRRLEARIRDQCRCRVCGMTDAKHIAKFGQSNHVHHIKPVSEFVEDGEINGEKAHELSNLITLCLPHHNEREGLPIDNRPTTSV